MTAIQCTHPDSYLTSYGVAHCSECGKRLVPVEELRLCPRCNGKGDEPNDEFGMECRLCRGSRYVSPSLPQDHPGMPT